MLHRSLTLLLILTAFMASAEQTVSNLFLEIRDTEDKLLARIPLVDQQWCLHWNHSVTGIAIQDCYLVHAGQMQLNSSWQPDFAAGLGHVEGRGELTSHPQGGYLIRNINEPVSDNRLWLRVGSLAVGHSVHSGDTHVNLSAMAAGQRLKLQLLNP